MRIKNSNWQLPTSLHNLLIHSTINFLPIQWRGGDGEGGRSWFPGLSWCYRPGLWSHQRTLLSKVSKCFSIFVFYSLSLSFSLLLLCPFFLTPLYIQLLVLPIPIVELLTCNTIGQFSLSSHPPLCSNWLECVISCVSYRLLDTFCQSSLCIFLWCATNQPHTLWV